MRDQNNSLTINPFHDIEILPLFCLSDDLYEIMSSLSESVVYSCTPCSQSQPSSWKGELKDRLRAGLEKVLANLLSDSSAQHLITCREVRTASIIVETSSSHESDLISHFRNMVLLCIQKQLKCLDCLIYCISLNTDPLTAVYMYYAVSSHCSVRNPQNQMLSGTNTSPSATYMPWVKNLKGTSTLHW